MGQHGLVRRVPAGLLAVVGVEAKVCVFATLMHASFLGYDCILIEDACATPSPEHCTDAVTFLVRPLYGFTVTTSGVIKALKETTTHRTEKS